MAEIKDKVVTVESLSAVHDYNKETYLNKNGSNKLLWSGAEQMSSDGELVSKQQHGIMLVFSRYDNTVKDIDFCSFFIPKYQTINYNHCGMNFIMSDVEGNIMAKKYLYIHDTGITGYTNNNTAVNGSCGISWTNNGFVLRYIIGV